MYIISDVEHSFLKEVIEDLLSLTDPSNYLKTEAKDILKTLRSLEYITIDEYVQLNQMRKDNNE